MMNLLTYLEVAKHVLPVVDTVIENAKKLLPQEKADVVAAWQALEKCWSDTKGAFGTLVAAVKAAIVNN